MLRKTMLDECRGERLEEVLAAFSSAVLKQAAEVQQLSSQLYPPIALELAVEKRGHAGERMEMNPLLLAHKASLRAKLEQKKASKAQYRNLAKLLDSKEQELSRRKEQAHGNGRRPRITEHDKSDMRRAVRNNWAGNEQWQEALVYGDSKKRNDGVLTAPFDRVWRRVRAGRLGELEDKSGGLLQQLDNRVRVQQERLGKWQNFRKEMFGDLSGPPMKESDQPRREKGIDLGLGVHESLQLETMGSRRLTMSKAPRVDGEYGDLLNGLETELKKINQTSVAPSLRQLRRGARPLDSPKQSAVHLLPEEPVSELSELEEELAKPSAPASRPLATALKQRSDSTDTNTSLKQQQKPTRPRLPQPLSSMPAFRPKPQTTEISPTQPTKPQLPTESEAPLPGRSPIRGIPPSPSASPSRIAPTHRTQSPEEIPPSPTQQQADQILASMNAASPSPVKQPRPRHTLSLAERTRLSLVRGSTAELDGDDADGLVSPIRPSRRNTASRSPKKTKPTTPAAIPDDTVTDIGNVTADAAAEEDDLVARTRKSMAGFEAAQQKARLERQRSQKRAARQQSGPLSRQTYFPSLDEEDGAAEEADSTAVLEELMAKEQAVDYDAVFKSRPKIKSSPPATPVRGGWGVEEEEEEEEL